MDKEEIFKDLQKIIVDKIGLEPEEIILESNFRNDLGFDSLDSIEIIMEVEKQYNISIPDEELQEMNLINEAIDLIDKKINS